MKTEPKIAVVCGYPFPEGMAATTRIIAYAKGMLLNGAGVKVYIYNPTGVKSKEDQKSGVFQGIEYTYPLRRKRIRNRALHGLEIYAGKIAACISLFKDHRKSRYSALIISSDSLLNLFLFGTLGKLIKARPLFIFDEYPIPIRKKLKNDIPGIKKILYRLVLNNIAGYLSMTENLARFYNKINKKPYIVISSITDTDRFNIAEPEKNAKYICYAGNMELSKDNVDNIIKAFAIISPEFPEVKFHLYGKAAPADQKKLNKITSELGLEDKVIFKGRVAYESIPGVLANSLVLTSSQPDTKRAEGGFPTKLGEYMSTGVPVLLTNVGEISQYITDGKNGYLCEPENPEAFAEKLAFILNNYELAKKVGRNGKEYIIENFSHVSAGRKMLDFINKL